jgi:hypothetical protein
MKKYPRQLMINEGLRPKDLKKMVSNVFTVDRYTSKMGEDEDVIVLGFDVFEKFPAIDLMAFIEKGYGYILDADISSGEEENGHYQVFVEIERTPKLPEQLKNLFKGIEHLTDIRDWRFRYQKSPQSVEFTEEMVVQHIPLTPEDYQRKTQEIKSGDVKEFFDQGAVDVTLESDNTITFSRPYSGNVEAKFVSIGDYADVKETLPGKLSLDESSQSQVLFLNKFIGNYDINKIGNKFLIRNGDRAVVIEKNSW